MEKNKRDRLPDFYEIRYHSELLKEKIADDGMWSMIPAVRGSMHSSEGIRRLKENDLLFLFIDQFFPDGPFDFEPNMEDGRFVFLPENVCHQGIGICASKDLPGFLEVSHFWYPCEFTEKRISFGPGQVYVPVFSARPEQLAEMVRRVYMGSEPPGLMHYCTFPFSLDTMVTLEDYFLDSMSWSVRRIRAALKNETPQIRRNGEGLIQFMQKIMKD
jgi:hypothetical protein